MHNIASITQNGVIFKKMKKTIVASFLLVGVLVTLSLYFLPKETIQTFVKTTTSQNVEKTETTNNNQTISGQISLKLE